MPWKMAPLRNSLPETIFPQYVHRFMKRFVETIDEKNGEKLIGSSRFTETISETIGTDADRFVSPPPL
jgi:hypothetical protein